MIVSSRFNLQRLLGALGFPLLLLLAYDGATTVLYQLGWTRLGVNDLPLPLLGAAIALIVTFRNNAAYDRWWEARGLWGAVVNNSRSFARGLVTFVDDPALRTRLTRLQIAYVMALRCALLGTKPWADIERFTSADDRAVLEGRANVPAAIHELIAGALAAERRAGALDAIGAAGLHATLSDLANAQGGLERIKRTPLPRQYNQFPAVFVALYCALLPIGLLHDLGPYTAPSAAVIGFMFMALDRIGRDLEDPFEGQVHDIPMGAITRTIEIDLLQLSGATEVPKPAAPIDGVLW